MGSTQLRRKAPKNSTNRDAPRVWAARLDAVEASGPHRSHETAIAGQPPRGTQRTGCCPARRRPEGQTRHAEARSWGPTPASARTGREPGATESVAWRRAGQQAGVGEGRPLRRSRAVFSENSAGKTGHSHAEEKRKIPCPDTDLIPLTETNAKRTAALDARCKRAAHGPPHGHSLAASLRSRPIHQRKGRIDHRPEAAARAKRDNAVRRAGLSCPGASGVGEAGVHPSRRSPRRPCSQTPPER